MIAISVSSCTFPIGLGLAQVVLPPVALRIRLAVRRQRLSAIAPALALLVILFSYRQPALVAARPRDFSWPVRRVCVLVVIAGAIWLPTHQAISDICPYAPLMLTGS